MQQTEDRIAELALEAKNEIDQKKFKGYVDRYNHEHRLLRKRRKQERQNRKRH